MNFTSQTSTKENSCEHTLHLFLSSFLIGGSLLLGLFGGVLILLIIVVDIVKIKLSRSSRLDGDAGMAGTDVEVLVMVLVLLGSTFLRRTNIFLIALEASDLLVDGSYDPGTGDDAGPFQEEAEPQKDVRQGVRKDGDGKGRRNELPGDGTEDGGNEGAHEAGIEEILDGIRYAKDVLAGTGLHVECGDTGNDEETQSDTELAADHEGGKVASLALEEEVAGLLGEVVIALLVLGHLGNGEEGNLHGLEESDDGHEEEEQDDAGPVGDALPHGGLALKESLESYGECKSEQSQRHGATKPEENVLGGITRGLIGFNGLTRKLGNNHGHNVRGMEDTRILQGKSNIHSKEGGVVVDVVQHHVTGGNLRRNLAKLHRKKDHGQTTGQKQIGRPGGEPVQRLASDGGTAHLHNKDDENDEELTAHEVAVEVVTLVGHAANLVRDLVRVLVQLPVDGGQTDEGALAALDHAQPEEGAEHDDDDAPGIDVVREMSLSFKDHPHDDDDGKDEETCRIKVFEERAGVLAVALGINGSTHGCLFID